ncbi:hypothetical protein AB0F43_18965 [Kribbella sp. NPDC023972]|uniref:hypothetical protein n=1 Tax=Kribbella sp. NPDC023972 TaxID=3154795 RepID=UPI003410E2CE
MAASVMGVQLVSAPAAQAAPDPKLQVTDITVGRTSVAVSGLNLVAVPVRVTGGYASTAPGDVNIPLVVHLQRTAGTGSLAYFVSADLPRVSGTTQNGEWAGVVNVPSTANGTFKIFGVTAGPFSDRPHQPMPADPTPFDGPALSVAGYHLPKITASVTPRIVPFGSGFSVTWAVTDSATGQPYATRFRVMLGIDNQCAEDLSGDFPLTSASGTVTKVYPASAADALICLGIPGRPWDIAGLGFVVARPGIVSAVPLATSAKVGTIVPVNGNVLGPPSGCKVLLQRLYGASQWRGVNVGVVRQSGRFTVSAQPAYQGLIPYRVYFPACGRYQLGISKVFYIRGL